MLKGIRDAYNAVYRAMKPSGGPRVVDMHIDVWRRWAKELGENPDECPSCAIPWDDCPCEFVRLQA